MSNYLSWGIIILSALFLYFSYGLIRLRMLTRSKENQREVLYKERLKAIEKGQPPPAVDFSEEGWQALLGKRLVTAPAVKVASFLGLAAFFFGAGVWAGLGLLPEYYVFHDFWGLGLIGVALGAGLLIYALCSSQLTKKVIAERKLG